MDELESDIKELKEAIEILNETENKTEEELEYLREFMESLKEKNNTLIEFKKTKLLEKCDDLDDEIELKSVNYWFKNGQLARRNVIVSNYENESFCRVYFMYPVYNNEIICKHFYFDKNGCNYDNDCKFSHGELIDIEDLCDAEESNELIENDKCLVNFDEGDVWQFGIVNFVDEVNNKYVVKIRSQLDQDIVKEVDFNKVVKLNIEQEEEDESDQINEDLDNCEIKEPIVKMNYSFVDSNKFGIWEQHTKGIGLKLMLKMGFEIGKGLGINKQGRLEPVEAVIRNKKQRRCGIKHKNDKQKLVTKDIKKKINTVDLKDSNSVKSAILRNDYALKKLQQNLSKAKRVNQIYSEGNMTTYFSNRTVYSINQQIEREQNNQIVLNNALKNRKDRRIKDVF